MHNSPDSESITYMIEPVILEIYLNKENYKERLLISDLKKKVRRIPVPGLADSSFFVSAEDVHSILEEKYRKDIDNFETSTVKDFQKSANCVFFIQSAMRQFQNLKYFRVHVSDNEKSAHRDGTFEYKIMHTKINIAESSTDEFIFECKRIFKKLGFYSPTVFNPTPYFECQIQDLINSILEYAYSFDEEDEEHLICLDLITAFGDKVRSDNPVTIIIMEK